MSPVPEPAPHVPVSLLLAGGAAVFSEECVKAMIACSINPDDVGTYSGLRAKRDAAGKVVKAHADAVAEGKPPPPEPTEDEKALTNSTVGHLERDAAYRKEGVRGNHCRTLVDGYTEGGAPSMILRGGRTKDNAIEKDIGDTEKAVAGARRDAAEKGKTGDAYPPGHRTEDEKAVISTAVDAHAQHRAGKPLGDISPSSVKPAGVDVPDSAKIKPNAGISDSDKAKECLENYKNALQTKEARLAAIDQAIKDQQAKKGDAAHQSELEKKVKLQEKKDNLEDKEKTLEKAKEERDKAQAKVKKEEEGERGNKSVEKRISKAEKDLAGKNASVASAEDQVKTGQTAVTSAQAELAELDPDRQIACLEERKARLERDDPNDPPHAIGRIPPATGN